MNRRMKTVGIVALVLAVAGVIAGVAIAQTQTQTTSAAPPVSTSFLAKVAANLGITEDALVAACEKANLETIDEAVAAGRMTAEQAAEMKARVEANQALSKLIAQGVVSGQLTKDQASLLNQGAPGRAMMRGGRGEGWGQRPSWMMGGRGGCR